jgi:exonuclease III
MNKIDFLLHVGKTLRDHDVNFRDLRIILCVAKISLKRQCESAEVMHITSEINARNAMHRLKDAGYLQADEARMTFTNTKRFTNWKISSKSEKLIANLMNQK